MHESYTEYGVTLFVCSACGFKRYQSLKDNPKNDNELGIVLVELKIQKVKSGSTEDTSLQAFVDLVMRRFTKVE